MSNPRSASSDTSRPPPDPGAAALTETPVAIEAEVGAVIGEGRTHDTQTPRLGQRRTPPLRGGVKRVLCSDMKVSFTAKEYTRLLELAHVGLWVAGARPD